MDDLLSEKEQIEQIRNWWSTYGGYIIFGVAAGAILLFGVNYYQTSKLNAQLEASALYQVLTDHVVEGKLDSAEVTAGQLAASYADTPYAAQAKLAIARLYMDKNRDQDAADALRELLAGEASDALKNVARLRLAKILLYQDKAQEVVDMLEGEDDPVFAAAYAEALGDAYASLGRYGEAEAAYQRVMMDPMAQGTVDQRLVQWKVLDLPVVDADEPATTDDTSGSDEPAAGANGEAGE